jgi:leucyl aminopeptidase
MTPEELTTSTAYSNECSKQLADSLEGVTMTEIVGKELNQYGYGVIYGAGKAAICPSRLVILEYNPPGASE